MPVLLGLMYALNIACIVHSIRTGRANYWLYILILVPGIGSLCYLFIELLPTARAPGATSRPACATPRIPKGCCANASWNGIAPACPRPAWNWPRSMSRGNHTAARLLYGQIMTGMYAFDPAMLIGRARAEFEAGDFAAARRAPRAARRSLELVQEHNPGHVSRTGHLLYARALEAEGEIGKATAEYEALVATYLGPEAKARFALMLEANGQASRARTLFAELVRTQDQWRQSLLPEDRAWFDLARRKVG